MATTSDVLIVARTCMSGTGRCIGALCLDTHRSLRLLPESGHNWDNAAPFQTGQVWTLSWTPVPSPTAPHVEDVRVHGALPSAPTRVVGDLKAEVLGHARALASDGRLWEGSPDALFGGCAAATPSGAPYVGRRKVSSGSTGFWVPSWPLLREDYSSDDRARARFKSDGPDGRRLFSYVGDTAAPEWIAAGSLCRISLARWWSPPGVQGEKRCYAQLSGIYDPPPTGLPPSMWPPYPDFVSFR